jgi:NADH dehydrogenase
MKVVIAGGGLVAIKVASVLKNRPDFDVEIVGNNSGYTYHESLLSPAHEAQYTVADVISDASNIVYAEDEIMAINTRVKAIKGKSGTIHTYDKLLLCMDGEYPSIPGILEYTNQCYDATSLAKLRSDLIGVLRTPHRTSARILVVGAGAIGVEIAGSIKEFATRVAGRYGIKSKQLHIELFEQAPFILPKMITKTSNRVSKKLAKLGVSIHCTSKVVSFSQNALQLEKTEYAGDIIVWAGGLGTPLIFSKYPEVFEINDRSIVRDSSMRVPKAQDVYVLADYEYDSDELLLNDAQYVANCMIQPNHNVQQNRKVKPLYTLSIGRKWSLVQSGSKVRSGRYGFASNNRYQSRLRKQLKHLLTK